MIQITWDTLKAKYEDTNFNKKLPHFYDFYKPADFKNVYEPSEDSFLLSDALSFEKETIINKPELNTTIELGCGSGYISYSFITMIGGELNHYCVDINEDALDLTKRLFTDFKQTANFIKSNLFEELDGILFDIIIFNPVNIIVISAICNYRR
jgi:release factor glutamine methyltransferase